MSFSGSPMFRFGALEPHLVFDLETGGLDPVRCGITQLAAVVYRRYSIDRIEVLDKAAVCVEREPGMRYEPKALEISHDEEARKLFPIVPLSEAIGRMAMLAKTWRGIPISRIAWAHKSDFDGSFIVEACRRNDLPMPVSGFDCTLAMFKKLFPGRPANLKAAMEAAGAVTSDLKFHFALDDAIGAARLHSNLAIKENAAVSKAIYLYELRARLRSYANREVQS